MASTEERSTGRHWLRWLGGLLCGLLLGLAMLPVASSLLRGTLGDNAATSASDVEYSADTSDAPPAEPTPTTKLSMFGREWTRKGDTQAGMLHVRSGSDYRCEDPTKRLVLMQKDLESGPATSATEQITLDGQT